MQLIFKKFNKWGSFDDEKEDVLRVKVKPVATETSVEWLKYDSPLKHSQALL